MLKRLDLVGFKSFADKTQFDFSRGITAVVGPNGSGKSNIVDAVRWILGEQSAKSLRGGEMADVIFNGSTSRKGLGLAEVTMTFDNSRRLLPIDGEEVQITRRVYRSGEGEYLINQQPSRLKDIKDLFLGSGAGGNAYCIIEQGRVDVLLQASTKERRTIFEEAAGISRFKAKKLETLRKLEHVDQNLQRLKDIIDEVDKQLRSVKLQASKAQRYQEYSSRLKELRVGLGLREYHELTHELDARVADLETLRAALAEGAAQAEAHQAGARRLEEMLAQLDEAMHDHESRLAHAREQIASEEATLAHERTAGSDLEAELARSRGQMTEANGRVSVLAAAASRAAEELAAVEVQGQAQRQAVQSLEEDLQTRSARIAALHEQTERDKTEHLEQMRQAARLQNDVISYKAQVDNLRRERNRLQLRSAQAAEHLATLDTELQELVRAEESVQARLTATRQKLTDQRRERELSRQEREQTAQHVADLRAKRSGLVSRIEVLEGLERSHEGLGSGVREVFTLLANEELSEGAKERESESADMSAGDLPLCHSPTLSLSHSSTLPLSHVVLGLVADLLTVRREYAPLIDLALSATAQCFLVRDAALLDESLRQKKETLSSRVTFIPLSALRSPVAESTREPAATPQGNGQLAEGVVARADDAVTCEKPGLADLPRRLLGETLIVRDLAVARRIWREEQTAGACRHRFVTLQGEVLDAGGTLTVGMHHADAGLLSRKSELRELREGLAPLDQQIGESEQQLADLRDRIGALDAQAGTLEDEIGVLSEQAADLRTRVGQQRQRREGLHDEVVLSRTEITGVEQEITSVEAGWQRAQAQAEAAERQVETLQQRLIDADREIREREQEQQRRRQEYTAAKVSLATVEERLAALRAKHRQTETDLDERRRELDQEEQHLKAARARLQESQQTMLNASASLARWYLDKEHAERRVAELLQQREQHRQERHTLNDRLESAQAEWRAQQEKTHARELEANDLSHRRDTLADRLREDYQIELGELYRLQIADCGLQIENSQSQPTNDSASPSEAVAASSPPPAIANLHSLDATVANEEIAELRRKLARLGSVNLDALQELAELENRANTLQAQYKDLTEAQRSLQEIISKINHDSRRLFSEAFAAIRGHFQELFRKLFGGGMADIVLEDENDILESGVEIIARPPGKELRSISLMSGGEKTLTAVALLLAIFRSKPSPFCILDEVDAALDEANIARYTAVLREFLDRSQFIIVTHSKKTMAAADVLYGITMQESGVSKRVAVRFEDWPEEDRSAELEPAAVAIRNGH